MLPFDLSYAAWSGFSAINFLNPIMYQLFNVILTFWPILWYGLFDTNPRLSRFYSNPQIYSSFHQSNKNAMTFKKYLLFNLAAILVSFVNFYLT